LIRSRPEQKGFREEGGRRGESLLGRWARLAVRRRWAVIVCWAVVLSVFGVLSQVYGGHFVDSFKLPGAESQKALDLLRSRFPSQAGDSATLVFKARRGEIASPGVERKIQKILRRAEKLPEVTGVSSPYRMPGAISKDGRIAYAVVQYDKLAPAVDPESVKKLEDLADNSNTKTLRVEVGGQVISATETTPPGRSEAIGLAAAVAILLVAFGSVVAMGLPIATALAGLGTGLAGVELLTRVTDLSTFTPAFGAMIGLGVGIDYALFVVVRFREGLSSGLGVEEAVAQAVDTSGRAVVSAGTIVAIALLGLFTMGIPFITALGVAAALVVALSVVVAVTLLPALLALAGRNVDRWRVPLPRGEGRSSLGSRFSGQIQRRPLVYAVLAASLLVVLALPVFSMRLGFSDDGNKPTSMHSRRAYDLLTEGFGPGFNAPLLVVLEKNGGLSRSTLSRVERALGSTGGVAEVTPPNLNQEGNTAVITAYPTTSPQSQKTTDTVKRLRAHVLPRVLGGTGVKAYVGGATAAFIDIGDKISSRMPYFFTLVIGLSFLLLMAVFRSVLVPLKAAVMNLLSIGAAYGVLVAVFQWGWAAGIFGVGKTGPIESYLPMMLFAILFGLSMDYEVFLVSRIRESYVRSRDPRGSVGEGLALTARVITAAAAIMVLVFLSFVIGDDRIIKEFGLGLATAIFVDATVIRLVLVPATMTLLGRWNWWFPRWLDRIVPRLNIEGKTAEGSPEVHRLLLAGVTLEYLARRVESADGRMPNLMRAAARLSPDGSGTEEERARRAAREVLRPLAIRLLAGAIRGR